MSCETVIQIPRTVVTVEEDTSASVVMPGPQPVTILVIESQTVDIVTTRREVTIIESLVQGPPGPPGPQGDPGGSGTFREDSILVGLINGVNKTFVLPNGDKAINADPGIKIKVQLNGTSLSENAGDYSASESGGVGTGFDTIVLVEVTYPGDVLRAHYVLK